MTIDIEQQVPNMNLFLATDSLPTPVNVHDLFAGKKSVLFGVPGAFTPVCTQQHLPGYLQNITELKANGIHQIVCVSVNDGFVMYHWGKSLQANKDIVLLCDGDAAWTKAMGLDCDLSKLGLGTRSKRYAMVIDDNIVTHLFVEESVLDHTASSAQCMVSILKG